MAGAGKEDRLFPLEKKTDCFTWEKKPAPRVAERLERAMPIVSARAYLRVQHQEFAKFPKMPSWLPNCWRLFFSICQKMKDAKLGCQTLGDAWWHQVWAFGTI